MSDVSLMDFEVTPEGSADPVPNPFSGGNRKENTEKFYRN
jgi:hypothetical protein